MTDPRPRRTTRQQAALLAALAVHDSFRSAQEWHALLRDSKSPVGLATVYRTLQALAEDGRIDVLRTESGESLYRACSTGHHHHLTCRECGATVEVDGPAVESWAAAVARAHGYADVRHTVEISGTCPACTPRPSAAQTGKDLESGTSARVTVAARPGSR